MIFQVGGGGGGGGGSGPLVHPLDPCKRKRAGCFAHCILAFMFVAWLVCGLVCLPVDAMNWSVILLFPCHDGHTS